MVWESEPAGKWEESNALDVMFEKDQPRPYFIKN